MDEYCCKARPHFSLLPFFPSSVSSTYLNTQQQTISSDHIYFNIQLEYTHVLILPNHGTSSFGVTRRHALYNGSMEQIMKETTFASWFSKISLPKGAVRLVFKETLNCAIDMVADEEDLSGVLTIRVDLVVTSPHPLEDEEEIEVQEQEEEDTELVSAITRDMKGESYKVDFRDEENNCLDEDEEETEVEEEEEPEIEVDYEDNYGYDGLDEDEEEMEVEEEEEEENELLLAITRASEGDSYEYDHEDNYGYEGNNGFEEDEEEEMMDAEEYNGFIPADKSCIEELEILKVEEVATCALCFEEFNIGDFNIGFEELPCSHMFHSSCIHDWLVVGNCCPLCRFQFPSIE